MKSFLIIFVLIVSSECGLLNDLLNSKEESKPQSATESKGLLIKVQQTLKNGTKVVIDALGNVIRPKKNEETSKTEATESITKSTPKAEEIEKEVEANNTTDAKTDSPASSTEKLEVTTPKTEEIQNKTLPNEENADPKEVSVKNTTEVSKVENTGKNCTTADGKECGDVIAVTRTAFNGDACPDGKDRADDGTCVEVVK